MTIRNKILCAFLGVCAILMAVGAFGVYSISQSGRLVVSTFDRPLMTMSHARAALAGFANLQRLVEHRHHVATETELQQIDRAIERQIKDFRADMAIAASRATGPETTEAVRRAMAAKVEWAAIRERFRGQPDDPEVRRAIDAAGMAVAERLDELVEIAAGQGFLFRKSALDTIQLHWWLTIAALALALVLSALIAIMLARRIVTPIKAASAVAGRIAAGDLAVDVPPAGRDETGNLLAAMRVMQLNLREMMEREIAQRQSAQARLVDAIESAPQVVVLVDAEDRVVLANSEAVRCFGLLATEALAPGALFSDFLIQANTGGLLRFTYEGWGRQQSGGDVRTMVGEGRWFDGRWLRVTRSTTRDGGSIVFWTDVTDLKDREQQLLLAKTRAEAASAAKSTFVATMSHELRTPLNAIIGFAEVIGGEILGKVGQKLYADYARDIEASGRQLLSVINDILDLARSETGELELKLQPVCLADLFDECRRKLAPRCERGGLRLEFQAPTAETAYVCDPGKVRQIVMNLMSNAIKFTPKGGMVSLMGRYSDEGAAEIVVSDTGIGMRQEDIPVALTPFSQIDSRLARKFDGAGLGLPLTRVLVEMHGGQLQIASAPDAGTIVTVRLPPRQRSHAEDARAEPMPAA